MFRFYKLGKHERGLLFREGEFVALLGPGRHWYFDPLKRLRLDRASVRQVWLKHADLDVIARSGGLGDAARIVDLKDHERALVQVDGRFEAVLGPGLFAFWTAFRDVHVEVIDARPGRFEHDQLDVVLASPGAAKLLEVHAVEAGHVGVLFKDGKPLASLGPGRHAFWTGMGKVMLRAIDLRESILDVAGQEIMTSDKVSLRVNALVIFRVTDALRAVTTVDDHRQALYREAQLALRAVVGTRELDAILAEKDAVVGELEATVRAKTASLGVEVVRLGIRDIILPGEMRDLLNRVTEAKKAAEAALITRREETAAMRSQANTAKFLESSPTLMRMRELEVLEKVAAKANLTVVLGEKGLADRVVKMV